MTDRTRILTVTVALDHPYRADDIQPLMNAISQLRGVIGVGYEVDNIEAWAARQAVFEETRKKIYEALG